MDKASFSAVWGIHFVRMKLDMRKEMQQGVRS